MSKRDMYENWAEPVWASAKQIRGRYGITVPQIRRYAEEGLVRTALITRHGMKKGIRLFHVEDLEHLIEISIEEPRVTTPKQADPVDGEQQGKGAA
ncbi:MAG: hypothetical protein KDN05_10950 [Verrucomicrobiae bacterium]|nr:hypothetical protein [Verrucomicrobiae bacterium]